MHIKTGTTLSLLAVLLCGIFLLASCEKDGPECYEPITVRVSNGFMSIDTERHFYFIPPDTTTKRDSLRYIASDTVMPGAELKVLGESDSFSIIGTQAADQNMIRIALNPAKDSIRYRFRKDTSSTVFDTITFYYSSAVHFISNNCGYNYYYTLTGVRSTKNIFDSLKLLNNSVTNDVSVRNVQFYLKSKFK